MLSGPTLLALILLAAAPRPLEPCRPDSNEARAARASIADLGRRIGGLGESDSPRTVLRRFERLQKQRCFEGTRESFRLLEEVSAQSLQAWWRDGGERWLQSLLDLGEGARAVVIPPDSRAALPMTSALSDAHCTSDGPACAQAVQWQGRVQAELDALQRPQLAKRPAFPAHCTLFVADLSGAERYREWRKCLERWRPLTVSLPLAKLRMPQRGWLVIRGRRGHYAFCDEARAYSLATGAAYVAQSCSGLALRQGGTVDAAKTDATREWRVRSGQLPREDLQALTLLLLVAPHVEEQVQREAITVPLPQGFAPQWGADETLWDAGGQGYDVWFSTAQTRLSWRYLLEDGRDATGRLTWPDSSDVAESLAAKWLARIEERLVDGCPHEALPSWALEFTNAAEVNARDAPEGTTSVQGELETRLLGARHDCASPDAGH